jgi:CRP-like cAMP-binding protein
VDDNICGAHALIKLVDQAGKKTDEGQLIDFPISRQDISEMTGTTLHTVSRLLSAWEQVGLAKNGRKKVFVVNHPRLIAIATGH